MLNLNQLKKLYTNSPLWIQKLYASIPYDIRNGSDYRKWKVFLNEELNREEHTLLKIKELVTYAYDNTNYYKRTFDNLNISPLDINELHDFEKLPLIDKDTVRENYDDMTVYDFSAKNKFHVTTGGTSGAAMKFLQSKNVWKKELAFNMNYFAQYGYEPSILKASFRGGEFDNLQVNKYWKYNPIHNEIHFSPFHLNKENIEYYVEELNEKKPLYFHSYPSSLLLLMEQMLNNGLQLNYRLKAIFLISENFTVEDINKIKSFFNCDVSSFYGHTERLIFAPSYAKDLSSYKIDDRYGFFELIDESENVITENGQRGEIVGSSFDNFAMPLLRYKTNDYTHYSDLSNNVISTIEGRWKQEYLVGNHGLKIYLTALNMHSDIFKNVIKYQFHQSSLSNVELHIVASKFFGENDIKNILQGLKQKVGHAIDFEIKIVKQLELTSRGKFKNVITTL